MPPPTFANIFNRNLKRPYINRNNGKRRYNWYVKHEYYYKTLLFCNCNYFSSYLAYKYWLDSYVIAWFEIILWNFWDMVLKCWIFRDYYYLALLHNMGIYIQNTSLGSRYPLTRIDIYICPIGLTSHFEWTQGCFKYSY